MTFKMATTIPTHSYKNAYTVKEHNYVGFDYQQCMCSDVNCYVCKPWTVNAIIVLNMYLVSFSKYDSIITHYYIIKKKHFIGLSCPE